MNPMNMQSILDQLMMRKQVVDSGDGSIQAVPDMERRQEFKQNARDMMMDEMMNRPLAQSSVMQPTMPSPQMPVMPQQMGQQQMAPQQMQSLATPQYGIGSTPSIDQILAALAARQ